MRLLPDWLGAYLKYTERSEPPLLFKVWCGVSAIAAALRRKCFAQWEVPIYPNFYVVLVGPSGVRKSTAIRQMSDLVTSLGIPTAPKATTAEALVKIIKESVAQVPMDPDAAFEAPQMHSSITIISPEFSAFIGSNDEHFFSWLNDWYDCENPWDYVTKNKGSDRVDNIWVNLIGATTPRLLKESMPKLSVGGGFTSRCIFVFGDRRHHIVPDPRPTKEELDMFKLLLSDLEAVSALSGEFISSNEFRDLYTEWYIEQCERPPIDDDMLEPYLNRRPMHLRKLAMIHSASRGDEMILTKDDFERAKNLLETTEESMPRVFSQFGSNALQEVLNILTRHLGRRGSMTWNEILRMFHRDATREDLMGLINTMAQMKMCKIVDKKAGGHDFTVEFVRQQPEQNVRVSHGLGAFDLGAYEADQS